MFSYFMGVLIRKQKGWYSVTGIAKLAIITFIISLGYALVDTIWAVYMEGIFHNISIISYVSAFLTMVAFFSFFFLIPIIERNNKAFLLKLSLFFVGVSYLIFSFSKNLVLFFISALSLVIFTSLRINALGIIIRDKSSKRNLSRNEGLVYTFFNIAWLIGPLFAGFISQIYGIPIIFVLGSLFILISLFVFHVSKINDGNIKKKVDGNPFLNFKDYFKSKDRRNAYIVGGGVNFWLILIYLYMPIYILRSGLNELWIGYFLFAVSIPIVLLEYSSSKIAGKIGFKKMFKIGYLLLSLVALSCFFISNLYVIMGLLVIGSIGISIIEPTTEAYFFDTLKKKEDESRFYGPYNTTIDTSYFIGNILAGTILLFFDFKFVFIFFSISMFIYFLICHRLREIVESKRK